MERQGHRFLSSAAMIGALLLGLFHFPLARSWRTSAGTDSAKEQLPQVSGQGSDLDCPGVGAHKAAGDLQRFRGRLNFSEPPRVSRGDSSTWLSFCPFGIWNFPHSGLTIPAWSSGSAF